MAPKMERTNLDPLYKVFNEFDVVQNAVIGAHALYEFVGYYSRKDTAQKGVRLSHCFAVLPIVFTDEYTKEIYNRNFSRGSFIKVLTSDNIIFQGVQKRMEDLAPTTLMSFNIAFSSNLLLYDNETSRVHLGKGINIKSRNGSGKGYDEIIKASMRLGSWFAQVDEEQLLAFLNIKF